MRPFDLEAGTSDFYADPEYYDHEFRNRQSDVEWYVEQYLDSQGPVLELGVGSGRVAIKAVRAGAEVYGIDLSEEMLARCEARRQRLPKARRGALHVSRGDMRDFTFDRQFEVIGCPFNAFMHLYTREDAERCLASVKAHLAPGGLFAFDLLMPDMEYLTRSPYKRFPGVQLKHPRHGSAYVYSESSAYDPLRQLNQMWLYYDKVMPESPGPDHFEIQLSHRYFFPRELEALLAYNGFEVLAWIGDFDGPLDADSESMLLMCSHRD